MMNSLFSMFDPSNSTMGMVNLMLLAPLLVMTGDMKKINAKTSAIKKSITKFFKNEMEHNIKSMKPGTDKMISVMFMFILVSNGLALLPQTFTVTSTLTLNLAMALSMWMATILFNWTKNTKAAVSHLVPQGTPTPLMNFMVLIELTSNVIRPITLCVRLTANMLAGHLLIALLGDFLMTMEMKFQIMASIAPILLSVLETAVAAIQAYVFTTLITLYVAESQ